MAEESKTLRKLKSKAAGVLFPALCPFCKRAIPSDLCMCEDCRSRLPQAQYKRFAVGGAPCAAALPYMDEYAAAVKRYKFGKKADYARALAELTVKAVRLQFHDVTFDFVTAVPMSKKARRKRGFDHAQHLAKECACLLELPYLDVLEKHKDNKPQHTLKRSERAENVKGVFRVPDKSFCRGKNILLIDDIITSGNTLGECVRMLRRSGCSLVFCAAACTAVV